MDELSLIKRPIERDYDAFVQLFNDALTHPDGLLAQALAHIRQQRGKSMRPILIQLIARAFGEVSSVTQHAAVGLELLHTASLVHDDVVDESDQRRGQPSVNATYNNKVAVLVGDYVLSTALLHISYTACQPIVERISRLGRTLSAGEILQLSIIKDDAISEEAYYQVIDQKTAALFEACAAIGALSVGASDEAVKQAGQFGHHVGMIFQIRDDIFDYFDSGEIGKPTGNDMLEGKLTLPAIYALNKTNNADMLNLARKVKSGIIISDEIDTLIAFAKSQGGIDYAETQMWKLHAEAQRYIDETIKKAEIRDALTAYLDYVIKRTK